MYQIAALGITLVFSIFGGLLAGFSVACCCPIDNYFDDEEHFREVEFDIELEEVDKEKEGTNEVSGEPAEKE